MMQHVIITGMNGETLREVSIDAECTVRGLKQAIECSMRAPAVEQILYHRGTPLGKTFWLKDQWTRGGTYEPSQDDRNG